MNYWVLVLVIGLTGACCFGLGFGLGYRFWVDYIEGVPGRHRLARQEDRWEEATEARSTRAMPGASGNVSVSVGWLREAREKLASTGELRLLAETGEIERLHAETAAWHAITRLEEWTR